MPLERTLTAGGTDRTAEAKKFMWLKKFLVSRGGDRKVLDKLSGSQALRRYGLENGYLQTGDEPDEPEGASAEEPDPVEEARRAEIARQQAADLERLRASDLRKSYLDQIAEDPNLAGITTMAALRARLEELSAALTAQDADGSEWKQLTFSGEHPFPRFEPHRMQKHKGMDGGLKVMTSYYRYAISSGRTAVQAERIVKEALEELAAGAPSPIMPGLFHGGYKSLIDKKMLKKNNIKLIVNTANNVGQYVKGFPDKCVELEKNGVEIQHLGWQDCKEQILNEDQLVGALQAIERTRNAGGGALVNCMQGKSRSGAVVTAYVAAKNRWTIRQSLALVQEKRGSAQPNNNFMNQLRDYEKARLFKQLHAEWVTSDGQAAAPESANKSVQEVCDELNERDQPTNGTSVARVLKLANGSEHVYYGGECL